MKRVLIRVVKQDKGERWYKAYDKQGKELAAVTVIDCGQGAHNAMEWFAKRGLAPSQADWATKLNRELERREER